MNHFLKKTLTFLAIFALYAVGMYGINSMIIKSQRVDLGGKKTVIVGDSHPMFALDPAHLGEAANVAQTSEPYYITYWKLKKLIKDNPIDTLLLGFSYHNLSAFNDKKLEDPFWSSEMFRRTYPIAEFEDLKGVEVDFKSYLSVKFKNMCLYPRRDHVNYLGKYANSNENDISDYQSVISRHYYYNDENVGVSASSIQYLDSITTLCRKNTIELILVSNPMRQEYLARIPQNFVTKYQEVKKRLTSKGMLVFDYGHVGLDEKYFMNADHLNQKGAELFTKEIKAQLTAFNNSSSVAKLSVSNTIN